LEIEARLGRVRLERWGPRTIDLDLLLYGGKIIDLPHLKVPHPEMRNRAFVLMPLSDIAPHDLELPPDRRLLKDVLEDCLQVEKTTRKCYEKKCLVL
jgi:2-amino-4-hydroxy-6-hydroxymethyldihydropteridine diphosphokinase